MTARARFVDTVRGLRPPVRDRAAGVTSRPRRAAPARRRRARRVGFVALLAYGLTTKAPDRTIDDALSRGQAVAPPGFELARSLRPRAARRRAAPPPTATSRSRAARHAGRPELLGLLVRPVPRRGEGAPARLAQEPGRRRAVPRRRRPGRRARTRATSSPSSGSRSRTCATRPRTHRAWGVTGLPETFFLAADGRVVGHVIGTVDERSWRGRRRRARRAPARRRPRAASSARSTWRAGRSHGGHVRRRDPRRARLDRWNRQPQPEDSTARASRRR